MTFEDYDRFIEKSRKLILKNELFREDEKYQDILKSIQHIEANRKLLSDSEFKSISLSKYHDVKNKLASLEKNLNNLNEVSSFDSNKFYSYLNDFLNLLQENNLLMYSTEKEIENMPIIEYDFNTFGTRKDGGRFIKNVAREPEKVEKHLQDKYNKYIDEYKNEYRNNNSISDIEYNNIFDKHKPALNIINIAKEFSKYIIKYSSEHTSTIIGIFGQWGRGKTFFYEQIEKSIKEKKKKVYFCKFQPWKYQQKESAWAYLYEQLLNNYIENKPTFLKKIIVKYNIKNKIALSIFIKLNSFVKLLYLNANRLGVYNLISSAIFILLIGIIIYLPLKSKIDILSYIMGYLGITGSILLFKTYNFIIKSKDIVSDLIHKYGGKIDYSKYLGFQNEIEKEIKHLINTYITDADEKLIIFVDDIDRCNEKMIVDIMDSLRLVLEDQEINSKIIMITAVDERILLKAIEHKYFDNNINNNNLISSNEYMEKFFLIGVKLSPINHYDIEELVNNYANTLNKLASKNNLNNIAESHSHSNTKKSIPKDKNKTEIKNEVSEKENIEEELVLNNNETMYIKYILSQYNICTPSKQNIETPRQVNRMIQRYLLFKSFLFIDFTKAQYNDFGSKLLIELVLISQKNPMLNSFIKEDKYTFDDEITLIDMEGDKHTIKKKDLRILLKYAEMVTPF